MDLNKFEDDEQVVKYLKEQIDNIHTLDECRLHKEEQYQTSEEVLWFRNCIEWVIRINEVIVNIKYALKKCLEFAEAILWPLEETENKRLYSYYLEDAAYRNIVLWDMFKQLLNEFYKCGYSEKSGIKIFKFLENSETKIGEVKVKRILEYLNSSNHQMVRNNLRHSFTHSVDPTSPYVFHRLIDGKIEPQSDYIFPNHPYENINYIIMDVIQLIEFISEVTDEMYEYRNTNIIIIEVLYTMPCGKVIDGSTCWNIKVLKGNLEKIVVPCETSCDKRNVYKQVYVCKPIKIHYRRIHSQQGEIIGTLTPKMTFAELVEKYGFNK